MAPILLKEVPAFVAKFVSFELVSGALTAAFPEAADAGGFASAVLLPLASGAIAGVCAVLVSHPSDVVLTR